mgnify:CR=1 FL=1
MTRQSAKSKRKPKTNAYVLTNKLTAERATLRIMDHFEAEFLNKHQENIPDYVVWEWIRIN